MDFDHKSINGVMFASVCLWRLGLGMMIHISLHCYHHHAAFAFVFLLLFDVLPMSALVFWSVESTTDATDNTSYWVQEINQKYFLWPLSIYTGGSSFENIAFCLEEISAYNVSNSWVIKPALNRATLCQSSPLLFSNAFPTSILFAGVEQIASGYVYTEPDINLNFDFAKYNAGMWHWLQYCMWVLLFFSQLTNMDIKCQLTKLSILHHFLY